ncbi:MAG: hypothetical protein WAN38_14625, partial [Terriglobales bacterium]
MTSTPSNAVTFASVVETLGLRLGAGVGLGAGLGLGAPEFPSALVALTVFSFAVFASLLPAMTGAAVMASTRKADNHFFTSNMDGVSSFRAASWLGSAHGPRLYPLFSNRQVICVTSLHNSKNKILRSRWRARCARAHRVRTREEMRPGPMAESHSPQQKLRIFLKSGDYLKTYSKNHSPALLVSICRLTGQRGSGCLF